MTDPVEKIYIVEMTTRTGKISDRFATVHEARRFIDSIPLEALTGMPFLWCELPDGSQRIIRDDGKPLQAHRLEDDKLLHSDEIIPLADELPEALASPNRFRVIELRRNEIDEMESIPFPADEELFPPGADA